MTVDPGHAYEVSRELIARNIIVDFRKGAGVRIGPYFYNSDEEIRLTIDTIKAIVADGSWQKHEQGRSFVT